MRRAALLALALGLLPFAALAERAKPARPAAPRPAATLAAEPLADPTPGQLCRQAITLAERDGRLPPGLLRAIAMVESGRADPDGPGFTPWPWTINAEGKGRFFATKAEAIAEVEALRARGVTVIDVGCMQVNLHHHPQAFPTLEVAFDPVENARYATLFLNRLYAMKRDWEWAAGSYHSATQELGDAYRLRVFAAWPAMAGRLAELRARDAMAFAWGAAPIGDGQLQRWNGITVMALPNANLGASASYLASLTRLPGAGSPLRAASGTRLAGGRPGLLDPQPPRGNARPAPARRPALVEVAEARR